MLAPEGIAPVVGAAAAAAVAAWLAGLGWSVPLWLLAGYLSVVFREHRPRVPPRPLAVVSPVSGEVTLVDARRDPWLDREATRVRVRLAAPGVTGLRSPTEGRVDGYWTEPEPLDCPPTAVGSQSPNCYALHVRTDESEDLVCAVSSTLPVSRMRLDIAPGGRVGHGHRFGFVYFARFVDVLMPAGTRAAVEAGARVRAGESVLANLSRP